MSEASLRSYDATPTTSGAARPVVPDRQAQLVHVDRAIEVRVCLSQVAALLA